MSAGNHDYNQDESDTYTNPLTEPSVYAEPVLMAEYGTAGGAIGGAASGGEGAAVGILIGGFLGYVHGMADHGEGLGSKQAAWIKNILTEE
ncbi:MAG: hypothetical protein H8Z69_03160 [Nanohaloarchaea archaeon]|nr:hypothetical protein [Candidatus Nanohaloarchaea archaeon]